eukprot:806931-Alexandrium_andersonii.AAC.1
MSTTPNPQHTTRRQHPLSPPPTRRRQRSRRPWPPAEDDAAGTRRPAHGSATCRTRSRWGPRPRQLGRHRTPPS